MGETEMRGGEKWGASWVKNVVHYKKGGGWNPTYELSPFDSLNSTQVHVGEDTFEAVYFSKPL